MKYRQTPAPIFNSEDCGKCGLYTSCQSGKMEGMGSDKPIYLFVGEAPGKTEDDYNMPFIGAAGNILRETIRELGFDESECRFTNAIRCRPPDNRTPKAREINYCRKFLEAEIAQYKPKVTILLGNVPLKSALNQSGITAFNGTVIEREDTIIVPAFHPSYIMRNGFQGEQLDAWLMALNAAKKAGRGEIDSIEYEIETPETLDELKAVLARLIRLRKELNYTNIAFDVETRWLHPEKEDNQILMVSLAVGTYGIVVPVRHKESWFDAEDVLPLLENFLGNNPITGHNVRYDQKAIRVLEGIDFVPAGDTLNLSRLATAHEKAHGLKRLAAIRLNLYDYDKELDDYKAKHPEADPKKGGDHGLVPLQKFIEYSGLDAIACSLLDQKLYDELTTTQQNFYNQLIQPISHVLGRMETNGFFVDRVMAERYASAYEIARQRYYQTLCDDEDVAWYIEHKKKENKRFEFNPGSDVQMREIIFGAKGYEPLALTPTGKPSVSWKVIHVLKSEEPKFFGTLRMWNLLSDMLSKYLRPPVEGKWFYSDDDRCRVNYNLGGAITGRVSSSDPTNLQNIPTTEKEWGTLLMYKPIKNIFTSSAWAVPRLTSKPVPIGPLHPYGDYDIDGLFEVTRGKLVQLDYSGQELRVMASIANVAGMIEAFNADRDIHSFVTALLYGLPEDKVKSEYNHMRYRAKWVNWTLLYGGNEYTLHNLYGLTIEEAKELVGKYYDVFPEVLAFQKKVKSFAIRNGFVESVFGRKLKLHYITPEDRKNRRHLYNEDMRTAINFPIQGTASDLLLMAMVIIQDKIDQLGYRSIMVNTVHDSVVLDCPLDEVDDIVDLCKDSMENLPSYGKFWFPDIDLSWLRVNLKADCDIGIYYGSK